MCSEPLVSASLTTKSPDGSFKCIGFALTSTPGRPATLLPLASQEPWRLSLVSIETFTVVWQALELLSYLWPKKPILYAVYPV